jgi:hypothetical protein
MIIPSEKWKQINGYNIYKKSKVKQSLYTPWRRLGEEEV